SQIECGRHGSAAGLRVGAEWESRGGGGNADLLDRQSGGQGVGEGAGDVLSGLKVDTGIAGAEIAAADRGIAVVDIHARNVGKRPSGGQSSFGYRIGTQLRSSADGLGRSVAS